MPTSDDYMRIWTHYGEENQLRKLMEEAYELTDAVREHDIAHMEEELADVTVVIRQIALAYGLDGESIEDWVESKVERQLKRIEEGE